MRGEARLAVEHAAADSSTIASLRTRLESDERRAEAAEALVAAMRHRAEWLAHCMWYGGAAPVAWRNLAAHPEDHDACHAALLVLEAGDVAPTGREAEVAALNEVADRRGAPDGV